MLRVERHQGREATLGNLLNFANSGGRIFATHFSYTLLYTNGSATTGKVSYIGFFSFNTDGTMTFTRSTTAPRLTFTQTAGVNSISFTSLPGVHYTLYETNAAGLATPRSTCFK